MTNSIPLDSAKVLITGGSDGIGRDLAARFLASGARVLVTGRSKEKLNRAASELSGLATFVNDISTPAERERLARHIKDVMPGINILINNAGIQRRVALAVDTSPWSERQAEIDTLFSGPVHLNHLLVPVILAHGNAAIIANVTSGGAFIPQPFAPTYSACKAALHSYTMNLRFALTGTSCKVVEIIPPAIRTALAGPGATHGEPLDDFCDAIFAALSNGEVVEIGYGATAGVCRGGTAQPRSQALREFLRSLPGEDLRVSRRRSQKLLEADALRLIDAKLLGGCGLRRPAARDDAVDGVGEAQLRLPLLSVGITEIGKHVAGAAGDHLVGRIHRLSASACHNAPRNPVARLSAAARSGRRRPAPS
jgi:uncharacterized oxidoreductase